jgi:hypothetical protein
MHGFYCLDNRLCKHLNGPQDAGKSGKMKNRLSAYLICVAIFCGWTDRALIAQITLTPLPDGSMLVTNTGTAGAIYWIQAATNLNTPVWTSLVTDHADAIGHFGFVDQSATNYPCRFYRSKLFSAASFGGGLTAKDSIVLTGGASVDSFNGAAGPYSAAAVSSNAVVLTDSTNTGAISLNSGSYIYGEAVTGPGGTVVGSSSVTGGTANDANVQITDNTAPIFSTYSTTIPYNVTVGGTNYPYGVTTGNYMVANLNIGNSPMVVNGNAVIYCTQTGNNIVNISGSGFIYITPGSSLTIYSAGNIVISGRGVVNGNQNANQCHIFGLPTCTSLVYSGSAAFYGVVDVPEANFFLSTSAGAFGAFLVNTASISGTSVHYDETLGGN